MNNTFRKTGLVALAMLLTNPVAAMQCSEFNAAGNRATTLMEVAKVSATPKQADEYLEVMADHVGDLSGFGFSDRKKALKVVKKQKQLESLIRETLATTRSKCFLEPGLPMSKVAKDQFNYMLDIVAKELNL